MSDLVKTLRATAPHYQCSKLLNESADLIEQLQQRNSELQMQLDKKSEVGNQLKDSLANSFEREQYLKQERDELAATVERLTEKLKPLVEAAVLLADSRSGDVDTEDGSYATTTIEEMLCLESEIGAAFGVDDAVVIWSNVKPEIDKIFNQLPQANLNHVKRDCLLILARDLSSTGEIESNIIECIEIYANNKYPSVKDGE